MTSPGLTSSELVYQLEIACPRLLITHIDGLSTALEVARALNLGYDHVVVIDAPNTPLPGGATRIENLLETSSGTESYRECCLKDGEAKTKVAVLCYSSGTTGKPKAVAVSHYNFICNVIQMAVTLRVNEDYAPAEEKRYKSGDICAAGKYMTAFVKVRLKFDLHLEVLPLYREFLHCFMSLIVTRAGIHRHVRKFG